MIRRITRQRKEYIFRRNLYSKEIMNFEKKKILRKKIKEGNVIPTELKSEYFHLKNSIQANDMFASDPSNMLLEDEYETAGIKNPKIIITTAHSPTQKLIEFSKELRLTFPGSIRVNRGKTKLKEIATIGRTKGFTDVIVIHEHRGIPDGLVISHLPHGPTAYFGLTDIRMRHEVRKKNLDTVSEQHPHLIFDKFNAKLGRRIKNILKFLFPVPKSDTRRIISFINAHDFIIFRHHMYKTQIQDINLTELGPRFTMRLYQLKLGTLDMHEAEIEWILMPYLNTAKKRDVL